MAGTDHRHAKDVGKILLGALQDLKHIRGELDGCYREPGSDAAPAAAVIDRCVASSGEIAPISDNPLSRDENGVGPLRRRLACFFLFLHSLSFVNFGARKRNLLEEGEGS